MSLELSERQGDHEARGGRDQWFTGGRSVKSLLQHRPPRQGQQERVQKILRHFKAQGVLIPHAYMASLCRSFLETLMSYDVANLVLGKYQVLSRPLKLRLYFYYFM